MVNNQSSEKMFIGGILGCFIVLGIAFFYYSNYHLSPVETSKKTQVQTGADVAGIENLELLNNDLINSEDKINSLNQEISALNKEIDEKNNKIEQLEEQISNFQGTTFTQNTFGQIEVTQKLPINQQFGDLTEFPIISFSLLNDTGKIIQRGYFDISIIGNDGSKILSEQVEYDLSPGMLPGEAKNITQNLSFKWTKAALESTLGINSIKQANIVIEVNKLKDVDNRTYRRYNITEERRIEVKNIYNATQEISKKIRSYRDQINSGKLDQGTIDAFSNEIEILRSQSQKLDPDGWNSMEYYDLSDGEIAESMLISNIQVTPESK